MAKIPAEPVRDIGDFERQVYDYTRQWAAGGLTRRDLLKGFGLVGAAAALGPLAASAGPVSRPGNAAARFQASGGLKIARGQVTDSLDPQKTALLVAHEIMWQIYDSLIYLDEKGTVHAGLALSWSFSSDNLTVTYKLRPNVKFHDGTPFDATIVKETVARHLDPKTASPTSYMLGPIDSVDVIDPMTVAYKYKEPFVAMFVGLGYSYCAPISIPAVQKFGDQFGRNPVGTGPYKFVSWTSDDTISLAKNDEHTWSTDFYAVQQAPQVPTFDFMVIPDDATRIDALTSGQVDIIAGTDALPVDKINSLKNQDGITVYTRPAVGVYYTYLNQKIKPFDNLMVRQAINHAVDRDKLVQLVLDGNGKPATSVLASAFADYNPNTTQYAYDVDKAKSLMQQAGMSAGFETKYLNITGSAYQHAAESIQEDLSKINIKLSIESYPVAQWVPKGASGDYGMSFFYYTYSDPDILYLAMRTGQAFAWCNQNDPDLDKLLDEEHVEFDKTKRHDAIMQAQARMNDNAMVLLLWEGVYAAAMQSYVQGLAIDLVGFIHLQEMSRKSS